MVVSVLLPVACACGGNVILVDMPGDGGAPRSGDDGAGQVVDAGDWTPPNASFSCGWSSARATPCLWEVLFSADPVQCAGFSGAATGSQCDAICGAGPHGQAAASCSVATSNNPAGAYQLVCRATPGTC